MTALIASPFIHLLPPFPAMLLILSRSLTSSFSFFHLSASSACLSVSEACDWTADTLISIMLWHPSSTCVKIRKTNCVCVCARVSLCVYMSDFPVVCGASAAVTIEDRVQQSTECIKHVGKCLISKQAFDGSCGRTLDRRIELDRAMTFICPAPLSCKETI